ncbi:MAG: hypothetical protein ACRENC_02730, partial [Gemmatimonadaceae bacterium]
LRSTPSKGESEMHEQRRKNVETMRHALVALLSGAVLWAMPAHAQTRFQWPDTSAHVARYSTMEDCLAADERVKESVARRVELTQWRDTIVQNPREALEPQPAAITQTASQCAARFAEAKVDIHDFAPGVKLFLAAGRDSDAAALVARRIAAVPEKHARERGVVVDSAVGFYLDARPKRLEPAEDLLLHRARSSSDRVERLKTYSTLMIATRDAGDTARARRAARWVVDVADSLTLAERQSDEFERLSDGNGGQILVYDALDELTGFKTRMDSLRKSTLAYATLERGNWSLATGERPEALQMPIGVKAAPLAADYWYPASAGSAPRPTPGHTTLIVFLEHTGCIGQGSSDNAAPESQCVARMAEVRRLALRFPTLEIDIVMSTHGQFMYLPPTTPAEEAVLIKNWVDAHQVPGAVLGVTNTQFWRLPEPDSRRIDKDMPNTTHYSFGKSWKVGSGSMFLVDSEGIIADAWRVREEELGQFIEVLLDRQHKGN